VRKVWVNGTFDVLHPGHIKLLQYAWQLGDYVCVGLDTNERIRQNKGEKRPIHTLEHRVFAIRSIKWVDEVVTFGTDDELIKLMNAYKPNIHVIGGDYRDQQYKIIGKGIADNLVFFDRVWDYSSSRIVEQL
jgi:D-beta-D-heptose 7-phosphate kinase/D-beta-D-heptose 1-phosphate adenosyltransferase